MIATALEGGGRARTSNGSADARDESGKRLVACNGPAHERKITIGSGTATARTARGRRCATSSPNARRQACWVYAIARVPDSLPKRLQPTAKKLQHEIMEAPTRAARVALERFRDHFDAKYPKATAKLDRDWRQLTAFHDFPAEHWRHLQTSNAIESSLATVTLRTRVTKRAGSETAALAMAYKLLDAAQERWRRFNGHEVVADVLGRVTLRTASGHGRRYPGRL